LWAPAGQTKRPQPYAPTLFTPSLKEERFTPIDENMLYDAPAAQPASFGKFGLPGFSVEQ